MIWTKMAERAAGLLAEVQTTRPARLPSVQRLANLEPDLSAVLRMTDATGMLQHSIYSIPDRRSEEHTSELQSLMRISYAVFCLKKKILRNYKYHQHSI